jgi:glycosyltransferase involved in cell wall biosynthesis
MRQPKVISHLFRRRGNFFSIERVFMQLEPEMSRKVTIRQWTAPKAGASPVSLLKNIIAARSAGTDLYHITGDIHYLAFGLPGRRTILTIHDCVFLYQSSGLKRRLLKWLLLDWPVSHCALITTISEATKQEILKYTGCKPEKVRVIPNPVNDYIFYVPRIFSETPVLLFIGTTPNKNLLRAIPALKGIACRLNIIGPVPPEAGVLLQQNNISYSQQSNLTDEGIANVYSASDIVLFPSTFEGFGLPIVEGQKAGRPVITSDLDPMREVAGGAACLVDPYSVESIRAGVLRIIKDKDYREQLVEKGFRNIERFSTEAIAGQYLSCYKKLLSD